MIEHRICSIKGIKAEKEAKKRQEAALGQQLAKLTIEQARKDQTIELLGKQLAMNALENANLKKEVEELKEAK